MSQKKYQNIKFCIIQLASEIMRTQIYKKGVLDKNIPIIYQFYRFEDGGGRGGGGMGKLFRFI